VKHKRLSIFTLWFLFVFLSIAFQVALGLFILRLAE